MAGFTSLALVGAGMLAGKLLGRKNQQQPATLAPGPTNANEQALNPPAPPVFDPAAMNAAATQAAIKQRKRAAGGSLLTNPTAPKSSTQPVPAAPAAPRTLYGR